METYSMVIRKIFFSFLDNIVYESLKVQKLEKFNDIFDIIYVIIELRDTSSNQMLTIVSIRMKIIFYLTNDNTILIK